MMTRRLLFALLASPLVKRFASKPLLKAGDRIKFKYIGTNPVPDDILMAEFRRFPEPLPQEQGGDN